MNDPLTGFEGASAKCRRWPRETRHGLYNPDCTVVRGRLLTSVWRSIVNWQFKSTINSKRGYRSGWWWNDKASSTDCRSSRESSLGSGNDCFRRDFTQTWPSFIQNMSIVQVSFGFIYGRSWLADSGIHFCGQGHTCSTSFWMQLYYFDKTDLYAPAIDATLLSALYENLSVKMETLLLSSYDSGHLGMGVVGWILARFQV